MNQEKLDDILFKQKSIQIPYFMLGLRSKWKLEYPEFIMLMYLKDRGKHFPFNPKEIENELSLPLKEVMKLIGNLQDVHLLHMETVKNEKGMVEDFLCLEDFYHRYTESIVEEIKKKDISNSGVYELIEKEFGRTLSPMEVEIIRAWLEDGFHEELIEEALKEATFNGVSNLRYIDKILYEWNKKGIHTKQEVEQKRLHHKKQEKETAEVFEYNWYEDDEIDE